MPKVGNPTRPDGRPMTDRVTIYDTTLRDGCQGTGISLSLEDKLSIARKLDDFGVDYIEGGWPGANPKDSGFFVAAREEGLQRARVSAFGSTRHGRARRGRRRAPASVAHL
jgi:2-isopropylmalate synthase